MRSGAEDGQNCGGEKLETAGTRWYSADRFHFNTVFGRFKSSGVGDCQRVMTFSSLQVNPVSIFKEADLGMGGNGVLLKSAQVHTGPHRSAHVYTGLSGLSMIGVWKNQTWCFSGKTAEISVI